MIFKIFGLLWISNGKTMTHIFIYILNKKHSHPSDNDFFWFRGNSDLNLGMYMHAYTKNWRYIIFSILYVWENHLTTKSCFYKNFISYISQILPTLTTTPTLTSGSWGLVHTYYSEHCSRQMSRWPDTTTYR
jgi:hypothetical protein